MSSYNYNVQISLASSNSISRKQEKTKNASKKYQDQAEVIMKRNSEAQNKVSAVPGDEISYQVHNEKEHSKSKPSIMKKAKKEHKEGGNAADVLVDDNKGKKVNVVC